VGDDDVVTLDVLPRISAPDPELTGLIGVATGTAQQTTAFQTRSLRTSARLQDGQALILGGLLSRDTAEDANLTPWLSRLPVLGWLFSSFRQADDGLELVILVSPALVRRPLPDLERWTFEDATRLLGAIRDEVDQAIPVRGSGAMTGDSGSQRQLPPGEPKASERHP
jgi:Flp pilus assembly secretin CpaC